MKVQGRENASWGFRVPKDGWHSVVMNEGISVKVNETSGKESMYIPFSISEGSEDDGIKLGAFINTRDENRQPYKSVEQQIADVVYNVGLADGFDKTFPGDVSYLDAKVIEMIKIKVPGTACDVEVKVAKDNKGNDRVNVVTWAKYGTKYGKVEAPKAAKKEKAAASTDDSGWKL